MLMLCPCPFFAAVSATHHPHLIPHTHTSGMTHTCTHLHTRKENRNTEPPPRQACSAVPRCGSFPRHCAGGLARLAPAPRRTAPSSGLRRRPPRAALRAVYPHAPRHPTAQSPPVHHRCVHSSDVRSGPEVDEARAVQARVGLAPPPPFTRVSPRFHLIQAAE